MISLLFATLALGYTHKDFPFYLDKIPVKKACNRIEFFHECSELSHYRGKDYIVFRWHDKATLCEIKNKYADHQNPDCTWVSQFDRIRIRKGCLISWCGRKK